MEKLYNKECAALSILDRFADLLFFQVFLGQLYTLTGELRGSFTEAASVRAGTYPLEDPQR